MSLAENQEYVQCLQRIWQHQLTFPELLQHAALDNTTNELAAILYQTWIARHPDSPYIPAAWFNLGVCLANTQDHSAARNAYENALRLKEDFHAARTNLGLTLEKQGDAQAALSEWQIVEDTIDPEQPDNRNILTLALNNAARLLERNKQHQPACQKLEKSLLLHPNQPSVIHHLIFQRQKQCQWPIFSPVGSVDAATLRQHTSALAMLNVSDDPAAQLAAARNYVEQKIPRNLPQLAAKHAYGHEKIRIAYCSGDFCTHPVAMLIVELLETHDKSRFEIYAFCWSPDDGSALRQRIIDAVDHYIPIHELDEKKSAECIREHEIDILVDLHGQTSRARAIMLAYRPAPIQITYLGLPATTGLPCVDYVIADRFLIPEEYAGFYSEKPLYLPDVYQASDRKRESSPAPTKKSCGLPGRKFIFCSFNNNHKYTLEVFTTWMNILRRVPNSVLWLLADNEWAEANLRQEAKKQGIDPQRLIFAKRTTPADYLARYLLADLFLDTFPFNAGTTANDALWMGLPVLTLSGRAFAARMAGALLTAAGLPELITQDLQTYEDKAVALAGDSKTRKALRQKLAETRENGPLFNTARLSHNLEAQYIELLTDLQQAVTVPAIPQAPVTTKPRKLKKIAEVAAEAERHQATGDIPGAVQVYRLWLKHARTPHNWLAEFNLGILLRDSGDTTGAQKAFQAALQQKPDFTQARAALKQLSANHAPIPMGEADNTVTSPTPAKKRCNYCQQDVEKFIPYRNGIDGISHTLRTLEIIGSDVTNFACPHCASTDRERHLKIYCAALNILKKNARVLHFAPEWQFATYISEFDPEVHIFADINSADRRFENINIEKIPYPDDSFDYVIANHILEHVKNPDAALAEINRVLKNDGRAILQTQYSNIIHKTWEDSGINSDMLRLEFYGQEDHVRLFGLDVFEKFSTYLEPAITLHHALFDASVAPVFGVNEKEPFFLFKKKSAQNESAVLPPLPPRITTDQKPLVSVVCTTYNHEHLIRQTLESFLNQKTDFNYEVLIGEDCSTDATRSIIQEFSSTTRCTLKPFFHKKNKGACENLSELLDQATGKYIAICEGDDYWIDNHKLQKQVDHLEANPDTSLVYTGVNSHRIWQATRLDYSYVGGNRRDLTNDELKLAPPINTLTTMFRNVVQPIPKEFSTAGAADMFLWSMLGWHGNGHYLPNILPSIYRQHSGGIFSSETRAGRLILDLMTSYSLLLYYQRIDKPEVLDYYAQRCYLIAREIATANNEEGIARLRALPSKMGQIAARKYKFDSKQLSDMIQTAIDSAQSTSPAS